MADRDAGPTLSIVIVSRAGGPDLLGCVETCAEAADDRTEVIVAECADCDTTDRIRAGFPAVRIVHFDERRPIPDLRAAGMLAARGDIIALTTDRCRPNDGWVAAMRQSHAASEAAAIGGAIEFGGTGARVDWAIFFCEYGRFMLPVQADDTIDLPAQNVSYKRGALEDLTGLLSPAVWEPLWHRRLRERGRQLRRDPTIVVTLNPRGSLRERYHYARSFAGQRLRGRGLVYRAAYAAATPLLPMLIGARLLRDLLPKRRHGRELLLSVPYLALFLMAWAAGECAGAMAGPGHSAEMID